MSERPCGGCDRVEKGRPFRKGQCRICWLFYHDKRYARLWDGQEVAPVDLSPRWAVDRPCHHLGQVQGERVCPTCPSNPNGSIRVKTFTCALHGACSLARPIPGAACCRTCKDYIWDGIPYGAPVVRNLLFHVWPVAGNGVWQWHVKRLLEHMHLFNGKRAVAIVTSKARDKLTDPPEKVKELFGDAVTDYEVLRNNPARREAVSFGKLFSRIANTNLNELTFYCQGKGVRGLLNENTGVRQWVEAMHEGCLEYLPYVEKELLRYASLGVLQHRGRHNVSFSGWHYAGTFFWLRNARVFGKPWQNIDRRWWGMEAWPGLTIPVEDSTCMLELGSTYDIYNEHYWEEELGPRWAQWKQEHAPWRRSPDQAPAAS